MSVETYETLTVSGRPDTFANPWPAEFDPELSALEALWKLPARESPMPEEPVSEDETYAQSLRTIHELGRLAAVNCLDTPEGKSADEMLHREYLHGIAEMLSTDKEFSAELDVEPENTYEIKDGKVVTQDGTPVVDMVRRGRDASREAARHDPRMYVQAYRDQADLENAITVDEMQPGQLRVVLSMDPKEALDGPDAKFWEDDLGYRKGKAFLQWYYKAGAKTMVAGSVSVGLSDLRAWRAVLADQGTEVPANMPSGDWIRYALEPTVGNADAAREFVRGLRTKYYHSIGADWQRLSVTEFIAQNQQLVDATYGQVYRKVAQAEYSQRKNNVMHLLAKGLLHSPAMRPEILGQLRRICAYDTFDAAATRTMDFVVRYGAVEQMRPGLKQLLRRNAEELGGVAIGAEPNYRCVSYAPNMYGQDMLVRNLAVSVLAGVAAGRSYGGCAPVTLSNAERVREELSDPANPQLAYGGRAQETMNAEQAKIPNTIRCIKCRTPSPKKDVIQIQAKTWRCPHCKYEIDVCTGAQKHASEPQNPKSLLELAA